jgi:hypothetical protein
MGWRDSRPTLTLLGLQTGKWECPDIWDLSETSGVSQLEVPWPLPSHFKLGESGPQEGEGHAHSYTES